MKKTISIIAILAIITLFTLTGFTCAATLDNISVDTDKATVEPGKEVKVTVNFGQELGSYTAKIAYDNNIFEYVSAEGGTGRDTTDKVIVEFHDETGGSNPRTNMSVKFKAKDNITTSNPTEFTVTLDGLANADASETYDDITTPIVKNVTVEPNYVDYTLKLEHKDEIIKDKENEMKISYSSPMGHYYEHARLIAEAKTPEGATAKLLAIDENQLEHDIIQSGWGDAQGYKIGGKDVAQELAVRGVFSEVGEYTITLKLIDRDNSDSVIEEKDFKIIATEEGQKVPDKDNTDKDKIEEDKKEETKKPTKKPTKLPKTGMNIYLSIGIILISLSGYVVYIKRK
ncbi:MAG: LPXTG cell wall anchor domain-containing protein [Clostridia bacterium]|nr:LPXTG cell wall anchor domain-containing protein [Clostridia bacterium]